MPQVDPVGAAPHPYEGPGLQHPPQGRGRAELAGDHRQGAEADQDQSPAVGGRGPLGENREAHGDDERPHPQQSQGGGPPGEQAGGRAPTQLPGEGQGDAQQQPEGVGVRAVVDAGGVLARDVETGHQRRGGDGPGQGQEDARGGAAGQGHDPEEQQRPDQVELLLHGQGPEVHEQHGGGVVEVGAARGQFQPVGGEGQRAEDLPVQVHPQIRAAQQGRRAAHGDDHEQRRQQAPGPPDPEAAQVDPPGAGAFAQQKGGDEETRDHEEHVHPEEAAGQQTRVHVIDDDGEHRDRPQGVQAADVEAAGRGARGSGVGTCREAACCGSGVGGAVAGGGRGHGSSRGEDGDAKRGSAGPPGAVADSNPGCVRSGASTGGSDVRGSPAVADTGQRWLRRRLR